MLGALFVQWAQASEREAVREDRRLDRLDAEREAERAAERAAGDAAAPVPSRLVELGLRATRSTACLGAQRPHDLVPVLAAEAPRCRWSRRDAARCALDAADVVTAGLPGCRAPVEAADVGVTETTRLGATGDAPIASGP